MKKRNFYVYIHVKLNSGEIFYVGKGKGNRAYSKHNRNKFWHNIVNKYDYDILIIEDNLTDDEACTLEIKYIKSIGRRDEETGTLVNLTDGGDGLTGRIFSEEHKRKLSVARKRRITTEETKLKMSESSKKRKRPKLTEEWKKKISEGNKGVKRTEETRRRISEAVKKRYTSEEQRQKHSERMKKWWADRKAKGK